MEFSHRFHPLQLALSLELKLSQVTSKFYLQIVIQISWVFFRCCLLFFSFPGGIDFGSEIIFGDRSF